MSLRYPCLVLDHDDTVVSSTPSIHYPAFCITLRKLRPDRPLTLEQLVRYCQKPGFEKLCTEIMAFNEEEMEIEQNDWITYVKSHIPDAFPGFRQLLEQYRARGGRVCVVSHSREDHIRRDYRENGLPQPDLVFGWDHPAGRRKPDPWPLYQIMEAYGLKPGQLLMVDDLKPGLDMAKAAGVPFVLAGWGVLLPEVREELAAQGADFDLDRVEQLQELVLTEA